MIDLRSDTLTRPTPAMRRAMADAEVGDDVYGEDPSILALEERVAGMFGHEAALFVPSGTMGNQIGMRLVCEPGQEVLCDADAHVVTYEMGAAAASGIELSTYGRLADTASVCLSKGLGAPVGSVLVASAERIATARLWRKRLGGGMRQAGVLAAAGLYALDHHLPRLGQDHEHAQLLAKRLGVDPSSVETNMVVLDDVAAPVLAEAARAQGVLVSQVSPRRIRLVLHLDVDRAAVDRAADVLTELLDR